MGDSSRGLTEQRARLERIARKRAFESYMRHGRVPEVYAQLAEAVRDERKFRDRVLSGKALGDVLPATFEDARPTTHYVWHTAGDERVRSAHAANAGRIFPWGSPPATGHPGQAYNCRCWAEPYYGNPTVPDTILPFRRDVRTDASGQEPWTRIETLTRPDGSVAETSILGRDGTRFHSTFVGTRATHEVIMPDGRKVTVETRDGVQSVYVGDSREALFESRWTANGPVVTRARQRVAFLLDDTFSPDTTGDLADDPFEPLDPFGPNPTLLADPGKEGLGAAALALLLLFQMHQGERESLGAGSVDVPVIAFKAWQNGKEAGAVPIRVDALSGEQVRQQCKRLPDVQAWTDAAAAALTADKPFLSPTQYGSKLHKLVKDMIDALKDEFPVLYGDLRAELSVDPRGRTSATPDSGVHYGQRGTTRLDVIEFVNSGTACVYDIKTGSSGLGWSRIQTIAQRISALYPGATFYIIEVWPSK